ncbi:polysaccharide biosynthesis protein [Ostreibacterium oceani]|uniref:NAD-dependent epimerase/dehydratase family protein n=1 Tax=Ostreibacterium oceani TaxID=2654998 RepID=A0A6N7EX79_9GAMM|nr:nucleoside-diphosphate sugar epimerase/dehydratase [Ostreibacterium oceani]MPV85737.1 NAD-dependent epimerase/dehydratase family protein [Ostreibacterium oceani]
MKIERFPRLLRLLALALLDSLVALIAIWIALAVQYETLNPYRPSVYMIAGMVLCLILGLWISGVYKTVLRFVGEEVLIRVLIAALLSVGSIYYAAQYVGYQADLSFWVLLVLLWTGAIITFRRFLRSWFIRAKIQTKREPVLIYGAGSAGRQLCAMLQMGSHLKPIAFIDDDTRLWGRKLMGLPIISQESIAKTIEKKSVHTLLFAIPALDKARQKQIFQMLSQYPLRVRTVPSVQEITRGEKKVSDLSDVHIMDIIGRQTIPADNQLLMQAISGLSVMVTGAGGSIGAELCRQIVRLQPAQLVVLDISEIALYHLQNTLEAIIQNENLGVTVKYQLGSVLRRRRMQRLMQDNQVNVVYHAAAYKHVPIVENNPIEGVLNNVFGTHAVVEAAQHAGVELFILISTDKAVRPTNLMGASKRVAEMILQAKHQSGSQTKFSMVRFGNVVGSSGSVIPLFQQQIRSGGPVTVTHPEVTRFFMTIPEAAQLVIQASAISAGGDVFLLDMGKPIKIKALAEQLIHLSGYTVKNDSMDDGIAIVYTGLRPGEKMYEELLITGETEATCHPMIKRGKEPSISEADLTAQLLRLRAAAKAFDYEGVEQIVHALVPEYIKVKHDNHPINHYDYE